MARRHGRGPLRSARAAPASTARIVRRAARWSVRTSSRLARSGRGRTACPHASTPAPSGSLLTKTTVRGVVVEGKHSGLYRVNAKAVVLAAGGYGQNKEMVAFYRPTFKGMTSSNNVTSTGDGVRMALEAGASMTDIDWIQYHPTVGSVVEAAFSSVKRSAASAPSWSTKRRALRQRTHLGDRASDVILKQPGRHAWLRLRRRSLRQGQDGPRDSDHLGMLEEVRHDRRACQGCRHGSEGP